MADQRPNTNMLPPTPLDVMSNWLYAEPVEQGGRRPNFRVRVMGNVPRMQVKTNVQEDAGKNNGRIDFNCDLPTFSTFTYLFREFLEGRREKGFQVTYQNDFVAGQKRDSFLTLGTIRVDKDEQGRIWLALLAHNRPKIRFFFGPSQYHQLLHHDGSEMTPAELSQAYAMGWLRGVCDLVKQVLVDRFDADAKNVPKAPNQQNNGGNRGSGGNGGGSNYSGGGRQGSDNDFGAGADDFDDF